MAEHTPGPWKGTGVAIKDANEELVATLPANKPNYERYANRDLISAAPDLLEAAELAIACMAMEGDHKDHDAPCWLDALTIAHSKTTP